MNKYISIISVLIGCILTFYNNIRMNTESYLMSENLEFTYSSIQPTPQDFMFIYLGIFLIVFGISSILYNLWINEKEIKNESNL